MAVRKRQPSDLQPKVDKKSNKAPMKIKEETFWMKSMKYRAYYLTRLLASIVILGSIYMIATTSVGRGSKKTYRANTYEPVDDPHGGFGLIIPVRDEREWLGRTLMEFTNRAPEHHIGQICIYDDFSEEPVSSWLADDVTEEVMSRVIILRSDKKTGLMDGRVKCSEAVRTKYLLFLDGHTMPMHDDWSTLLLNAIKGHNKRLVVPRIISIARSSWLPVDKQWRDKADSGIKMIFDWTFEFYWLNGRSNQIPILAGGIFAVDRDYFFESGSYDTGMKEWGAENIEQSLRVWQCGGEIISHPEVTIGHIFDRPAKPNPGNKLVERIWKNHLRTARVWLDDSMSLFLKHHHSARTLMGQYERNPTLSDANISDRLQLRKDQNCKDFAWFLTKFRADFDRLGLLENDFHRLKVVKDNGMLKNKCLTINRKDDRSYRTMNSSLTKCVEMPRDRLGSHGAGVLNEDAPGLLDQAMINSMGKRIVRARSQIAKQGEVFRIESHCIQLPNYAGEKLKWTGCKALEGMAVKLRNDGGIYVDTDREVSIFRERYNATLPSENESGHIIYMPIMPATEDGNDDVTHHYVKEYCFSEGNDPCLCVGLNTDNELTWMKCQKDRSDLLKFSWQ